MTARETLASARAAGIRVGIDGANLVLEADQSPPQELLEALQRDKMQILNLLSTAATSSKTTVAKAQKRLDLQGLTLSELQDAAGEDWSAVKDKPHVLEALAHAIVTRRQRVRGERPPDWTAIRECARCGPVYLWLGSPAQVLACPWCFNRAEGRPIPRPLAVRCSTCRHFRRIDHPRLGHCTQGELEASAGLWATDRRDCTRWLPLAEHTGDETRGN